MANGGDEDNCNTARNVDEKDDVLKKKNGSTLEVQTLRKLTAVAALVGFLFGVTVLAISIGFAAKGVQMKSDELKGRICEKIEKYAESKKLEGTGLDKTPEVIDVNRCRRDFGCTFNVLSCSTPCPLGFKTESECAVSCECATSGVTQLDLQFDEDTLPALIEQLDYEISEDFAVFTESSGIQLWNETVVDGRVRIPWEIDQFLDTNHEPQIFEAFEVFREHTCIDFVRRTKEEDYIFMQKGDGDCSAGYSRHPGRNNVNIASCHSSSHILHVLMHSLGFHHEHMRDDRDAYVEVVWDNVDPVFESAFNKLNPEKYISSGTNFDKESIMMLDGYAFSKNKDEKVDPTMLDLDTSDAVVGGGSMFTVKDLESIATVYCDGLPENALAGQVRTMARSSDVPVEIDLSWSEWTAWSRCQATCGNSIRTRRRRCKIYGFLTSGCPGSRMETKTCSVKSCPELTGSWGDWGEWGQCSKSCGRGIKMKRRKCSAPGQCKGKGPRARARRCYLQKCPNDKPRFSKWSRWSACDKTCGFSHRMRRRECINVNGTRSKDCLGRKMDKDGFEIQFDICFNRRCHFTLDGLGAGGGGAWRLQRSADLFTLPEDVSDLEYRTAFDQRALIIDAGLCDPLPNFRWFTGDFNGDGRTDAMCGENVDLLKLFLTNPDGTFTMRWTGRLNCNVENIFIGDFNGDGADDVFCKDDLLARNLIYTSNRSGTFGDYTDAGPFCMNVFDRIQVIDINGDGRSDLVCKHPETNEDTDIYISALTKIG